MRVDEASRTISAPLQRVFGAFLDPDDLRAWLPPHGMTGRLDWFDPIVGGGFRMLLTYDSPTADGKYSDDSDLSEARIVELEQPHRIVWAVEFPSDDPAFAGTMTMTWTFEPDADATRVTIRATDVPPGIDPADHAVGLNSSLAQLAMLCEESA